MKTFALVLILLVAVGCTSFAGRPMDEWLGKSAHELIIAAGPPSYQSSDGAGGYVMVYTRPGFDAYAFQPNAPPHAAPPPSTKMFYVNSAGLIYRWSSQGL